MRYFTFNELCRSERATRLGIENVPTEDVKENLRALVENVLDPAREALSCVITVNSGFRCPVLNKAVGGARSSQHVSGEAVDITRHSRESNKKLYDWIAQNCEFDQLINEYDFSWVHVSFKRVGVNRMQKLKIG